MDRLNILPLLGLALRGGNLAVGEESVETAAQARSIRLLLLASDVPENTRRRVERFARTGQCLWTGIPFSKEELGRALGRPAAALAAVTDTGLAVALGRKLALLDPEAYGELSQRLELKAQRARERRAERETREKTPGAGKRGTRRGARETDPKIPPKRPRSREDPGREPPARRGGGRGSDLPPHQSRGAPADGGTRRRSARSGAARRGKPNPYAHSRPVKKGKGSFRKRED